MACARGAVLGACSGFAPVRIRRRPTQLPVERRGALRPSASLRDLGHGCRNAGSNGGFPALFYRQPVAGGVPTLSVETLPTSMLGSTTLGAAPPSVSPAPEGAHWTVRPVVRDPSGGIHVVHPSAPGTSSRVWKPPTSMTGAAALNARGEAIDGARGPWRNGTWRDLLDFVPDGTLAPGQTLWTHDLNDEGAIFVSASTPEAPPNAAGSDLGVPGLLLPVEVRQRQAKEDGTFGDFQIASSLRPTRWLYAFPNGQFSGLATDPDRVRVVLPPVLLGLPSSPTVKVRYHRCRGNTDWRNQRQSRPHNAAWRRDAGCQSCY